MNATIDGYLLEQIEQMEQRLTTVVKSRDVALKATRDFSREEILNLKACYSACHCRHFIPNENNVCTYRNCRHSSSKHYGWNRIRLVDE